MSLLSFLDWLAQSNADVDVPRLRISDRFPDSQLLNQRGTKLNFRSDFIDRGKAVVINSMYTTCRGSCPRTGSTIRKLRRDLYPIFHDRLVFLSFTLEPLVDTVPKLDEYATMVGASVGQSEMCDWHLLTGASHEIEELRRALGFYNLDPKIDIDVTQHGSMLLVGYPDKDRWTSHVAELPYGLLMEAIRRTVGNSFEERYGVKA